MENDDVSESMVEVLWKQGMDTFGIAKSLKMDEAEVEKELNRFMDKKSEEKGRVRK